ncbi:hypothetical protein FRC07_001579 [Ceratobasidium sp. 392]|nr:hypothetical protein FRC07_001579 [Ceratobasidium sp. 392]
MSDIIMLHDSLEDILTSAGVEELAVRGIYLAEPAGSSKEDLDHLLDDSADVVLTADNVMMLDLAGNDPAQAGPLPFAQAITEAAEGPTTFKPHRWHVETPFGDCLCLS